MKTNKSAFRSSADWPSVTRSLAECMASVNVLFKGSARWRQLCRWISVSRNQWLGGVFTVDSPDTPNKFQPTTAPLTLKKTRAVAEPSEIREQIERKIDDTERERARQRYITFLSLATLLSIYGSNIATRQHYRGNAPSRNSLLFAVIIPALFYTIYTTEK